MIDIYKNLLNKLNTLKEEYGAVAIKLEFESEYTTEKENEYFKRLALESGLSLVIKIGGCGSVRDIALAETLSPQVLVAPMIESAYSLDKFYTTAKSSCDLSQINLFFNIETIAAYKNIENILDSQYIENFKGIVFGRSDFALSLTQDTGIVESDIIFDYVNNTVKALEQTRLELIVGGNISINSKKFLQKIESKCFKRFETRKIIFDKILLSKDFEKGIELALEFEKLWLNSKIYKNAFDTSRLESIEKRISQTTLT